MHELDWLMGFFTSYGYLAVFGLLFLCGLGLPMPEDITLVASGILAGRGLADVHLMFLVGFLGVMVGDGFMFTAGRLYGENALKLRFIARIVTPERYAKVQLLFDKHGSKLLFAARFMPGVRSVVFITAGVSRRVPFWLFALMDGTAALISVPVWVYLAYYGAKNFSIEWIMGWVKRIQAGIFITLGVALLAVALWWWKNRRKKKTPPHTNIAHLD